MKFISSLILIFLVIAASLAAQNFEVIVEDTTAEGEPGDEVVLSGHIKNLTANPLEIELTRETNEIPDTWTSALCLGACAAPWVNTLAYTIAVNDSIEFSIHFFTDAQPAAGQARLNIKEARGTVTVSYLFKASTSSSSAISGDDLVQQSFHLNGNYPNPFNNSTIINFEAKEHLLFVKFQVFSIPGKLAYQKIYHNLRQGINNIHYQGTDQNNNVLPSGIYIYQLSLKTLSGKQYSTFSKLTLVK